MADIKVDEELWNKVVSEVQLTYKKSIIVPRKITKSSDAADIFFELFPPETLHYCESFYALYLDRANAVVSYMVVGVGGISSVIVDPRKILSAALLSGASGIIIAHNHPSGNNQPSRADILLTEKLKKCCEIMEFKLLDHIIILNTDEYFSMTDNGHIEL